MRALQLRLRDESGVTIVEVLAAAILVVLTSIGAFTALDAAAGTADGNKSRNVAASLAQGDLERLRGMNQADLVALVDTPLPADNKTVDGETYTVESSAEWIVGAGGATTCTAADAGSRYLRITSTVRWPNMAPIQPVSSTSIEAVNNATASGRGDLAVSIMNRTGATGVAGIPVSISGPESETQTTNANGCVFFDFIPAGSYTVSFEKPGWMESKLPNRQAISDTVSVSSDQTANKHYQYDQAGGIQARFRTRYPDEASDRDATANAFTVSNAELGSPPTKLFTGTAATTLSTGNVLFPFTGAYTVWAGRCDAAKLPNTFLDSDSDPDQTALVGPGATSTLDVFVPTLKITVRGLYFGTYYAISGARVVVTPASPGCPTTPRYETTTASNGVAYFALPYGDFSVCSQYTFEGVIYKQTNTRANKTRNGSSQNSDITGSTTGTC